MDDSKVCLMGEWVTEDVTRIASTRHFHLSPRLEQVTCSRCTLEALCLPRGLSEADVHSFEQIVHRSRPIHTGEHLFRIGDEFRDVATVRAGCFKSYITDREGHEQVLAFHYPGEIVGLDAIHTHRHAADVVALDTSAVCNLEFESISSMAQHMPKLQNELFRVMSQHISELKFFAGDTSADERMANFLIAVSGSFAGRGYSRCEFRLVMSRSEIASYLNLATETVSRVLTRFQTAGWLQVNRKQVTICDFEKLHELSRHRMSMPEE